MDVAQADLLQCLQFIQNTGNVGEKLTRVIDGHVEDVGNIFALVFDFQRFPVVARTVTNLTGYVHIGQEIHFNADNAIAVAGLAAAAFNIKAKAAGLIAAHLRFGRLAEKLADKIKDPRIGCRIGTRCPANWRLVNVDDLIDVLCATQFLEFSRPVRRMVHRFGQSFIENFIHQG